LKADFISSISHELRTPLVAMVETNEALLDDVAGALTDQQRRMITLNRGAALRLSVMIGDLLELSVVRSGLRYRMASTTLDDVITDAASELEARARDHKLTLAVRLTDRSLRVTADRDRLLQVVQNLIANAIKFTPAGGTVEVSMKLADRAAVSGNGARSVEAQRFGLICVDDTGPGIPAHDRERVFEKFFRRQGVSADGVGLGLAICREIVLAHRGVIWIEDGRLGGATLCVAIPLELI
jgi:signal transduction histidine kinase